MRFQVKDEIKRGQFPAKSADDLSDTQKNITELKKPLNHLASNETMDDVIARNKAKKQMYFASNDTVSIALMSVDSEGSTGFSLFK